MADVEEAQRILEALGMPPAQHSPLAGMTLLALCGLTPDTAWSAAERRRCTVTKGIMDYLEEHYGTDYAPNTRETFRRQVPVWPVHRAIRGALARRHRSATGDPARRRRSDQKFGLLKPDVDPIIGAIGEVGWENV